MTCLSLSVPAWLADILLFPDKKQRTFQPPPTGENRETPAWGVQWEKHTSLAIEAFFSCSQGIGRPGSPLRRWAPPIHTEGVTQDS